MGQLQEALNSSKKDLNPIVFNHEKELYYGEDLLKLLGDTSIFKFSIYQSASTDYILNNIANNEFFTSSLICGGRVVNELPSQVQFKNGADFDSVSAYGGVLETIQFPIGKPHIYFRTANQTSRFTLKQFF